MDFSVPYMYYTEDLLMKKSSSSRSIDLLQFLNPFGNCVWFATLASLVIISIAVFVLNYFSPYGYKDDRNRGTSEEFSFYNSVWCALASMLQQGVDHTPRSLSGIDRLQPRDKAAMLVVKTKKTFSQNLHVKKVFFPAEENALFLSPSMAAVTSVASQQQGSRIMQKTRDVARGKWR